MNATLMRIRDLAAAGRDAFSNHAYEELADLGIGGELVAQRAPEDMVVETRTMLGGP